MRLTALLLLTTLPLLAHGEACVVHSQGRNVDVKVCQENRSIPAKLFRDGFCQPQLQGQKVEVRYADSCPAGAFGICRDARVPNTPYRQDIHYYGVASDARFLEPFCASQSQGKWQQP
ncbi:hypothetical protein D9M68_114260 [compost metagenome]